MSTEDKMRKGTNALIEFGDEFERVAQAVFERTQDKDVVRIKCLTATTVRMAEKGELSLEQIEKSTDEILHNTGVFRNMLLEEDEPECTGVTFKAICPFHSLAEGAESVDGELDALITYNEDADAIWDLISHLHNAIEEMDWEALPMQGRIDKSRLVITVEHQS